MRKILLYILGFVLLCFTIPIIFTNRPEQKQTSSQVEEKSIEENTAVENTEPYQYSNYGTVRLLHQETGEVETLSMDEYIYRSCISRNASKF